MNLLNESTYIYQDKLYNNKKAINYLIKKRQLEEEIIYLFKLGYADNKNSISELFKEENVLCKKDEKTGRLYDFFRNRIIFPLMYQGNALYMSSRSLEEGDAETKKHLHISGTSEFLYNHNVLLKYSEDLYIVEGVSDCLTLIQSGFNAVAVLGISRFKKKFCKDFKKVKNIHILFDNDENRSGFEASINVAIKFYKSINIIPNIITLPKLDNEKKMDVNQYYINYGKNKLIDTIIDRNNIKTANFFKKFEFELDKIRPEQYNVNRDNKNIIDIISKYILLKKRGKYLKGLCPFHKEENMSLTVYPENNTWWCFGCGAGYTINDFLKRIKGGKE